MGRLSVLLAGVVAAGMTAGSARADCPQCPGLEAFLNAYSGENGIARSQTRYAAAFVHLHKGGEPQAVVYLSGEAWCGSGGCTTLVLARRAGGYRVISRITVSNLPIRMLAAERHGWQNLAVEVRGGGAQPGYEAALAFGGARYPGNPTVPPARPLARREGRILIPENDPGRPLGASEPSRP